MSKKKDAESVAEHPRTVGPVGTLRRSGKPEDDALDREELASLLMRGLRAGMPKRKRTVMGWFWNVVRAMFQWLADVAHRMQAPRKSMTKNRIMAERMAEILDANMTEVTKGSLRIFDGIGVDESDGMAFENAYPGMEDPVDMPQGGCDIPQEVLDAEPKPPLTDPDANAHTDMMEKVRKSRLRELLTKSDIDADEERELAELLKDDDRSVINVD